MINNWIRLSCVLFIEIKLRVIGKSILAENSARNHRSYPRYKFSVACESNRVRSLNIYTYMCCFR